MFYAYTLYAFIVGLCMGSFALATAWRLRKKKNFVSDTSECEHCHHKLSAKDLVPILSWLSTKGRCRYCHKRLSILLPLAELTGGLFFAASYAFWPDGYEGGIGIVRFVLWLTALALLLILFFYDLQWQLLPNKVMYPLWGVAVVDALLQIVQSGSGHLLNIAASVAIAWGLFWVLFHASGGKWIGYGDVRLGLAIGLLIGSPWLACLALFAASVTGVVFSLPSLLSGQKGMKSKIPFGPLLIIGLVVAKLLGADIIDWYTSSILLLS